MGIKSRENWNTPLEIPLQDRKTRTTRASSIVIRKYKQGNNIDNSQITAYKVPQRQKQANKVSKVVKTRKSPKIKDY